LSEREQQLAAEGRRAAVAEQAVAAATQRLAACMDSVGELQAELRARDLQVTELKQAARTASEVTEAAQQRKIQQADEEAAVLQARPLARAPPASDASSRTRLPHTPPAHASHTPLTPPHPAPLPSVRVRRRCTARRRATPLCSRRSPRSAPPSPIAKRPWRRAASA
jgi:hypothetical protein